MGFFESLFSKRIFFESVFFESVFLESVFSENFFDPKLTQPKHFFKPSVPGQVRVFRAFASLFYLFNHSHSKILSEMRLESARAVVVFSSSLFGGNTHHMGLNHSGRGLEDPVV